MDDCVKHFLTHDSVRYGLLFSAAIMVAFTIGAFWNLEMFLRSYPPDIKQKYGRMKKKSRWQLIVFAIPVYLMVVGVLVGSTKDLASTCGSLHFLSALANDWIILNLFNLVDLLVIDWLVFVTIQPNFIVLPGTNGLKGYNDYGFHFRGFLIGIFYTTVASFVVSGLTMLFVALF